MTGSLPPDQMAEVMRGLAMLALGTLAARPLALRLVPGGGGWIIAVLLAWAVMGWMPWMLSALGLVPFSQGALSGLLGLVALRWWLGPAPRDPRGGIWVALAYVGLFWLGLAQRLGRADLTGLEKFTDMGFLTSAMRAEWMPPQDVWFAGSGINYYYVGQAMAGAWGHLSGAAPDHAYQLAMASLFALTGLGTFRVTQMLARPHGARISAVLGTAAAAITLFGGNLHSALYTLFRRVMPTTKPDFYYPDSTRFIGFDPPTDDKGFTEFPAYAFAVGDLHAHVIATPIFLLGVLILLSILTRGLARRAFSVAPVVALGWVLGLCLGINAWDFAVLGLLALCAALVLAVQRGPDRARQLDDIGLTAVLALATAFATAAPFLGAFQPFASGIEPAPAQTPYWQLLVVYGYAVLPMALFVGLAWRGGLTAEGRRALVPVGWILAASLVLVAVPETLVVRDIYGLDYARANTMFKLSFRAQPLFLMAGLAVLAPAVAKGRGWFVAALVAAAPIVALLAYLPQVIVAPAAIRSLDGLAFLGSERALVEAARGLPLAPGQALVEATGDAFGETARVSAMTGQPAVIGWAAHEWLWRSNPDAAFRRADRVNAFYTSPDKAARCDAIRRYGIRYAILGQVERRRYPGLDVAVIHDLGVVIFADAGGEIVQIDPARCPE